MAHNLINSLNFCGTEYIYWPISPYRKMVFQNVLSKVGFGDILDLGCGQSGVYWSLSYAHKASSICFFDCHMDNLKEINRQLSLMSPKFIEENFEDTYQFLATHGLLATESNTKSLATNIINKVDLVCNYDFRIQSTTRLFDTILSIESIECVCSFDELLSALKVCYDTIRTSGRLIGIAAKYDKHNEYIQELIDMRFAGALNPNQQQLQEAFVKSGFRVEELTTISTPELHNYREAIVFDVRKI